MITLYSIQVMLSVDFFKVLYRVLKIITQESYMDIMKTYWGNKMYVMKVSNFSILEFEM